MRGCPFNCKFCDIITLYGRKPRTKEPSQLLAELQRLYDLEWRGSLFVVDDNFIGNQRNVKIFLQALIPWMKQHHYPFTFITEASVNLAEDGELLALMVEAGFYAVFLGIETPDQDSLQVTRKVQNTRNPLMTACRKINEAGLLIYAGFILGFDGEKAGAGARIQAFVEETSIPQPMLGILQSLPNTALWDRLQQENRLVENNERYLTGDQNTLMNFIPTRPLAEIAKDYVESLWTLYDPQNYLKRCFEQCLRLGIPPQPATIINVPRPESSPVPSALTPTPAVPPTVVQIVPVPPVQVQPRDVKTNVTTQPTVAKSPAKPAITKAPAKPVAKVPTPAIAPLTKPTVIAPVPNSVTNNITNNTNTKPADVPKPAATEDNPSDPKLTRRDRDLKNEILRTLQDQFSNNQLMVEVNQTDVVVSGSVATPEQLRQIKPLLSSIQGIGNLEVKAIVKMPTN